MHGPLILISGLIFLLGLAFSKLLSHLRLPAVTAYLIFGVLIGPYCLDIVPHNLIDSMPLVAEVVLSMVAFSLGQVFSKSSISRIGRRVFLVSWGEVVGALVIVTVVMRLVGVPLYEALLFGGIAPATAPAATVMVIRELGAKGPFTETLLGVVAIDDAWGIMVFALAETVAKMLLVHNMSNSQIAIALLKAAGTIALSLSLGMLVGFVLVSFMKRLTSETDLLIAVFGAILLTSGISVHYGLSSLLANMALGTVVANFGGMTERPFRIIKRIDWPFFLYFFVLSGASLEIPLLKKMGLWGIAYLISRPFGEYVGAFTGALIGRMDKKIRNYIGLGLVPQAGVALGLAILVRNEFRESIGPAFLTVIIAATIISELVGPIFTKYALTKVGEVSKRK
ncbi:MAG: cation:proton antiporter [Candidatus Hydrothermota bacterium]|nr:MAG: cation:proton antiporter [Candidatus Hydrothermae bacterium]